MPFRHDDRDGLDPREYPEPDPDGYNRADTLSCPRCHRAIYEEAERCPYCGNYGTDEGEAPPPANPWWIIVGALLVFAVIALWVLSNS